MAAVRSKNTKPELVVRRLVHGLGYRYRLHRKDLPGTPDMVFPSRRKIIEIRGCYWHGHSCPQGQSTPGTNRAFWVQKKAENRRRDTRNLSLLRKLGWKVLVIWQCQTKDPSRLRDRIRRFLV